VAVEQAVGVEHLHRVAGRAARQRQAVEVETVAEGVRGQVKIRACRILAGAGRAGAA
jgi:hypothetical protein